jgi:cysteinyl-tRNA synthetase
MPIVHPIFCKALACRGFALCDFVLMVREKEAEIPKEALELLALRNEARANKNWAEADRLRDALKDMGYAVEDSKEGAKLKKL